MTVTTREAFERGTEAFNAHDLDGFAEVIADDVVFTAPGGIRGEGKAACVEFFGSWYNAFPDAHVEVHKAHFFDDIVVEEGTFVGTHDGILPTPIGPVPPTGRAVSVPYIHTLRYRDGLHVSFTLLFDRLLMLEQLGLVAAPALSLHGPLRSRADGGSVSPASDAFIDELSVGRSNGLVLHKTVT
jgi:hypothetical protein